MDVHNRKSPRQNGPRLPKTHGQIRPNSKSQNLCDEVLEEGSVTARRVDSAIDGQVYDADPSGHDAGLKQQTTLCEIRSPAVRISPFYAEMALTGPRKERCGACFSHLARS